MRRARIAASPCRQASCGKARSGSSAAPAAGRSTRSSTSGDSIRYYRLVGQQRGSLEPARVTGRTFADFDDERVQAEGTEEAGAERRRTRLYLEGVHCAACVWLVEKLPAVLRGVDEVRLNVGSGVAEITWRPGQTRLSAIGRALDRLGYTPHIHRASRAQEARRAEDRAGLARLGVASACAMNLMFLHGALYAGESSGMATSFEAFFRWLSLAVAVPVLVYSARPFFQTAIAGLRARIVHIDLPIAIALHDGVRGQRVEHRPRQRARCGSTRWRCSWRPCSAPGNSSAAPSGRPSSAPTACGVPPSSSSRGGSMATAPTRRSSRSRWPSSFPATASKSGRARSCRSTASCISGRSSLDNAVLTGEAAPVSVREGDARERRRDESRRPARRPRRCRGREDARRARCWPSCRRRSRGSRPCCARPTSWPGASSRCLLVLAAVTGVAWLHRGSGDRARARRRPPGRRLSVRARTLDSAGDVGRADARRAIGDLREEPRRPRAAAQDRHRAARQDRHAHRGPRDGGALARRGRGAAVRAGARGRVGARGRARVPAVVRPPDVARENGRERRRSSGAGDCGPAGRPRRPGRQPGARRSRGRVVPAHLATAAAAFVADGLSPVFVALDGRVRGVAGIGDRLAPDARDTVAALRARGIRVRILSGDHPAIVARVARELGLPSADALGGLTPEAKRDIVAGLVGGEGEAGALPHSWESGRGCVVMVGDGVNDAAALALADVGIAVHGGHRRDDRRGRRRADARGRRAARRHPRRRAPPARRHPPQPGLLAALQRGRGGARDRRLRGAARRRDPDAVLVARRGAVVGVTRTFAGTSDRCGANLQVREEGKSGPVPYSWESGTEA